MQLRDSFKILKKLGAGLRVFGIGIDFNTPPAFEAAHREAVTVFPDRSDSDRVWECFAIEWHENKPWTKLYGFCSRIVTKSSLFSACSCKKLQDDGRVTGVCWR